MRPEGMGWTRRDVLIDQLIDEVDGTFPDDWSPQYTVRDVVRLWLAARKADHHG